MTDIYTDISVAKRNIVTLHEGLKIINAKYDASMDRITHLEHQLAMKDAIISSLMQDVAILKIRSMGTGSTSRG